MKPEINPDLGEYLKSAMKRGVDITPSRDVRIGVARHDNERKPKETDEESYYTDILSDDIEPSDDELNQIDLLGCDQGLINEGAIQKLIKKIN